MKTKLSLFFLILALSPVPFALSQIPQGFNYQAVAHTSAGVPISNTTIQVKMGILSDTITPVVVWEELHSTVKTNLNGVFGLVIGTGARQSGSAAVFSDIDWKISPLYLKIQIYYQSTWKYLGSAKLWSVPYAMVAGNMGGPVSRFSVEGETSSAEEALFEVKNKDGQTIFAVYNEGVRIYVSDGAKAIKGGFAVGGFGTDKSESTKYLFVGKDSVRIYLDTNPLTKKLKGGFAVGGYDLTKGTVQNYLDVSEDSVRIYIDSNPAEKKLKGGFAVGGYDMTKGITGDYFNVSGKSDAEVILGEPRVLWYPAKEAFRSGNVLIESKDSVGLNSWASGYRSKAIGNYSQALGYQAIARDDYSTAIGYQAVANKPNSFAFGQWALAKNEESYALGRGAIAAGFRSYAFGSAGVDSAGATTGVAYAKGDYSFALGQGSQALGLGSFAFGIGDTAKGDFSIALGYKTCADGGQYGSSSFGYGTYAKGIGSTALGYYTSASGNFSTTIGRKTTASGYCSTAMGNYTIASGDYSTAMGWNNTSSGRYSFALGYESIASGWFSIAMGLQTEAAQRYSAAIGYSTRASGYYSVALGNNTEASGDNSTSLGENTFASGIGSVAMGTYSTASGEYSTVMGNRTTASGNNSCSIGNNTTSQAFSSFVIGRYNLISGTTNTWVNTEPLFVIGNGENSSTRSNAVTVLKNGNAGIGTSTPTYRMDIASGNLAAPINSSELWHRLYGYSANQDQLKVRHRRFITGNDWSSAEIRIQKTVDVTDMGYISFKADYLEMGLGSTAHLTLKAGNFGIGNTDPGYKLVVNGTAWCSSGAWTGSDVRWKKDISDLHNVLAEILKLKPVNYQLRNEEFPEMNFETGNQVGLIAQDVEKVLPILVSTDKNGYKAVSYEKLSVILLEGMKEQQQQIETQNHKIDQLIVLIDELKKEIASLRSQ